MPVPYMEARTYGIGQLISERRLLVVPDHQRDFAWTEDIVNTFLDDVIGSMSENAADYFAGLIVLIGSPLAPSWSILDGQQRLATTTLVFAAIRAWLDSRGLAKDAGHLQSQFIGTTELGEESDRPRLTLNANNRAVFAELVAAGWNDDLSEMRRKEEAKLTSNRRLIDAAAACRKRVAALADAAEPEEGSQPGSQTGAQRQALYRLANYLRDNVRVVGMEVPSAERAYVIFETMNDRGLDLSLLDLIKNYVFGLAGDRLPAIQDDWSKMTAYLRDRRVEDFLKVFWSSQFGPIPRGRLLDQWKSRYSTPQDAVQLAKDLADAAEEYSALDVPEHALWADYSETCRSRVRALAVLGNRLFYPIMLSAFQGLDGNNMEELLGRLVTLAVRNLVAGNRRARTLEAVCARAASRIFSGEIASAALAWEELAPLVPDDDDFRENFAQFVSAKEPEARYLLVELERVASGAVPTGEAQRLDHVFPRSPSAAWRDVANADPELRARYVNRLGNLCLLEQKPGASASAGGFEKKKSAVYARSSFLLTRQIATDFDTWDRAAIERRQRQLADLALRAWPLSS